MSDAAASAPEPSGAKPSDHGEDRGRLGDAALHHLHEKLWTEKEEPAEGFSQLPILLIFLFAGLVFWSGLYIANRAGGFQWDVYDDHWRRGNEANQTQAAYDPIRAGERLFKANCQQCHGPEGLGQPGTYPPLAGSPWVVGTQDRPISILLEGMTGKATVLGNDYNGSMPALGQILKDKEVAAVLTFVRQAWGTGGSPVDEDRVAALRGQLGVRGPWSPDEMLKLHPLETAKPAAAAPAAGAAPAPPAPAAGGLQATPAAAAN
jgi:mono/diheme cytochrome c family protein